MNVLQTKALALQLEVNLDVDGEREKLIVTPAANITPELDAGLKENRDEIMRSLLISQAIEYVWDNQSGSGPLKEINDNIPYEDVEGASFQEFRKAVRKWAWEMVEGMKKETKLSSIAEVFDAFRAERDKRDWKEIA